MTSTTPFSTLARALGRGTRPGDLLAELHRELLAATGATGSMLLELTRGGDYVATSGRGVGALDAVWLGGDPARALSELAARGPGIADLAGILPVAQLFDSATALVIPIALSRRPALLLAASPAVPELVAQQAAARAAVEFAIALEWSRLAREIAFHRRMRELSLIFSRGIRSTAVLGPALETVAHEANVLLGTRRTGIWLHERRARELLLAASSDPAQDTGVRVAVDGEAPPALALRSERPQVVADRGERMLVVPLRGWRRALGAMVIEGSAVADDEPLLELGHELGRQLAAGIENVQLLDELLRQRRLLEDTFNSLADLVIVTDESLRVVQVNDECVERLGRSRDDLVDRPLAEVIGAEIARWAVAPAAEEDRSARAPGAGEYESDRALRSRTFEDRGLRGIFSVTVTPLVNPEEQTVGRVLVARDITARSRLESDREALRAKLAQSEKLAALGQVVAGIAHEMNNPLQGVVGHLELLIDHSPEARPIRKELRRVFREAERASRIVHNLLVFAGSRPVVRRPLRLDRVISRALASRRAALERAGIEVVRSFSDAVPPIAGDPLLLQQAFLNIIINAEYAIESRGAGGRIETTTSATDGHVVVTVRDTGPGIPDDVLPRIFDPFFTTKDVGKGTGLGLAITYGIVLDHGGTIQAANAPGGGAVFRITLPLGAEVM
jgi:PAS domain S-box-containing protein